MNRALLLALVACGAPEGTSRHARPGDQLELFDLVGSWRWLHREVEPGTTRVEDEQWRLRPGTAQLVGQYLRTVEVRSTDGLPFQCNQRPWYRQRALYQVSVEVDGDGFVVHETGFQPEPSPCEHGFRHLTSYTLAPHGNRSQLLWDGGSQTLWHTDAAPGDLTAPWADAGADGPPLGAWRWETRSYDDDRNVREESEQWEISRRTDVVLDATYRRRVTVRSVDGKPIACAGAPSWSFDDVYVLEGQREEQHWHFTERAVGAGEHPCLAATPRRVLDEMTAEELGDFLVLEWRGKRRQVLYRP